MESHCLYENAVNGIFYIISQAFLTFAPHQSFFNMFTGIIESIGKISNLVKEQDNLHITIESNISKELKIDQSISHNGVCLTVVELGENTHTVTAISETLIKTNLQDWEVGQVVNLERAMKADARLDGHFVQGHVDKVATCAAVKEVEGSWYFTFHYDLDDNNILVEKGSICVNGVSLTLVNVVDDQFSVAIIPYTYEQTNFHEFKAGTKVNLEFDVIGKYVTQLFKKYYTQTS